MIDTDVMVMLDPHERHPFVEMNAGREIYKSLPGDIGAFVAL